MREKLCAALLPLLFISLGAHAAPPAGPSLPDEDPLASAFTEELAAAYAEAPAPAGLPAADTASGSQPAAVSPDSLLPSTLGPMEHVFWGRHGLMRGIGFPLDEDTREKELSLRRTMLTLHQIGGFLTLGIMTATVITGQQIVNNPNSTDAVYSRKRLLAKATIYSYFTTAGLALLTPPPMIRRKQFSSLTLHKAFGVVHFTGMVIAPILGTMLTSGEDYDSVLRYHQINGYVTLAALAGAMLVITFD
jgi:hypothetical protein